MARRSTRLSSRKSTTPKRVSLSHDAPARTPKTAPVKLGTVAENDDMPGAFPNSASPPERATPSAAPKQGVKVPVHFDDSTPKQAATPKPSSHEMHPAQHHQSTAKPLDEARWLGFADMAPHTEPPKHSSRIATVQDTPTRPSKVQSGVTSPQYQFTFHREHSLELSPEAKRLMFEKREEAARIREQMMAAGEGREEVEAAIARKIATPKGKSGRFSQAHLDQFQKMDSIAGHASAFRADPTWKKPATSEQGPSGKLNQPTPNNLKRSPSKAQLDDSDPTTGYLSTRSPSKPAFSAAGSSLPRATSFKDLHARAKDQPPSPAKRVKRFEGDDATITRPISGGSETKQPATPSPVKQQPSYPDLTSLATPTQASLARATSIKSVKSSKIPGPTLARSPNKLNLAEQHEGSTESPAPLLARTPSKTGLHKHTPGKAGDYGSPKGKTAESPLLGRSPLKASLFERKKDEKTIDGPEDQEGQLLARSPLKMSVTRQEGPTAEMDGWETHTTAKQPLLSRSPMKMSVIKNSDAGGEKEQGSVQHTNKIPLFARSPMKMSVTKLAETDAHQQKSQDLAEKPATSGTDVTKSATPTKAANKSLMDRFTFLRTSPMKSILRSPQRLYSDDPAKVAAGTHLATPPKKSATEMNKKLAAVAKTAPTRKHVDFTSSTKARYERALSETTSTPSKENTPASVEEAKAQPAPQPAFAQYPALPTQDTELTFTPEKRRQTIAPGDFTFRAGPDGIVFGTSPNAPASMAGKKRPSTIRHVSAEPTLPTSTAKKRKFEFENDKVTHDNDEVAMPTTTTKKRKFEFENEQVAEKEATSGLSDKENGGQEDPDERPAKRVKPSVPSPEKKTKRPTLGVRPKDDVKGARTASGIAKATTAAGKSTGAGSGPAKEKRPATISQARLAALAQPKRRG